MHANTHWYTLHTPFRFCTIFVGLTTPPLNAFCVWHWSSHNEQKPTLRPGGGGGGREEKNRDDGNRGERKAEDKEVRKEKWEEGGRQVSDTYI